MTTHLDIRETVGWSGRVTVTARDLDGRIVDVVTLPNLIVDGGLDLLRDVLDGTAAATEITWVALGASTTPPAAAQTQLVDERLRKQVTRQQPAGTGMLDTSLYLGPPEANSFPIGEVGWFAGAATGAADSGLMVARLVYERQKTSLESLQLDRRDTIARA